MSASIAQLVANLFLGYFLMGLCFAVAFAAVGASKLDHSATGTSIGFRCLLIPGASLLWPLLLIRWLKANGEPPVERNAHRRAAERQS